MSVKIYEVDSALFEGIESLYENLGYGELVGMNFLYQLLVERGLNIQVKSEAGSIEFFVVFGERQLSNWMSKNQETLDRVQKLGYRLELVESVDKLGNKFKKGRIKIK